GEAQNDIAFDDVVGGEQCPTLCGADCKARQIIVAAAVHARHLCRLAADEGAACLTATFGDTGDNGGTLVGIELAGGKIVEEQERLGALNNEIVDTHGNQIDAHRVVLARLNGNLELGADAVVGSNQNRVIEAR